ncbi:MAG TPA: universal stress protein [Streptosporangiaceae bacterium]|nr:universal stress protein [Streptosporangiaceae bacterium]
MSAAQEDHIFRIVVGVDGSPCSARALRWAVRQARLTGGSVEAVFAWEYPTSYGGYGWVPYGFAEGTDFEEVAGRILADSIGQATEPDDGVSVRPTVVRGNPTQVLLDAAQGADLLVVGSRGRGGFTAALLGSVAQHCVYHAGCPVVVIRDQRDTGRGAAMHAAGRMTGGA